MKNDDTIRRLNQRIKRRQEESFNSMIVKSYKGMHIKEIAKFYPSMIDEHDVISYLLQCREYDMIPLIVKYELDPNSIDDDFEAMSGLICFCEVIQELSKRVCYSMSESVDDWLYTQERGYVFPKKSFLRQITTDYKPEKYDDFVRNDVGGKRFITKYEFEEFIKECRNGGLRRSVQSYPFSDDSLFIMLFQHQKEYGLDKEKIVDLLVPDEHITRQHRGSANDFIRFERYLHGEYTKKNSVGFSKKMILDHFLDNAKVIG